MEHRIGERIVTNLNAEIYLAGGYLGNFSVRNIGVSGLCVENLSNCLKDNKFLQVVVKPSRHSNLSLLDSSALVVWADDSHAGLMWVREGLQFESLLGQLAPHAA